MISNQGPGGLKASEMSSSAFLPHPSLLWPSLQQQKKPAMLLFLLTKESLSQMAASPRPAANVTNLELLSLDRTTFVGVPSDRMPH